MRHILWFVVFIPLLGYGASSPSFDCFFDKVSHTEWIICVNDILSERDLQLNSVYQYAIGQNKSNTKITEEIRKTQKQWLNARDNECYAPGKNHPLNIDPKCLEGMYGSRISVLVSYTDCNQNPWCFDNEQSISMKIIEAKLERLEAQLNLIASKRRDTRSAEEFILSMKKLSKVWREYVALTCGPIEQFIGGTGAGSRGRSCELGEMISRVRWLESVIRESEKW